MEFEASFVALTNGHFNLKGILRAPKPMTDLKPFGKVQKVFLHRCGRDTGKYLIYVRSKHQDPQILAENILKVLNVPLTIVDEQRPYVEAYVALAGAEVRRYVSEHPDEQVTAITNGRQISISHKLTVDILDQNIPFVAVLYQAENTRTPGYYKLEIRPEDPKNLGRIPKRFRDLPVHLIMQGVFQTLKKLLEGYATVKPPKRWSGWSPIIKEPHLGVREMDVLACESCVKLQEQRTAYLRPVLTSSQNHYTEILRCRKRLVKAGYLQKLKRGFYEITERGLMALRANVDCLLPTIRKVLEVSGVIEPPPADPIKDFNSVCKGWPTLTHTPLTTTNPVEEEERNPMRYFFGGGVLGEPRKYRRRKINHDKPFRPLPLNPYHSKRVGNTIYVPYGGFPPKYDTQWDRWYLENNVTGEKIFDEDPLTGWHRIDLPQVRDKNK